MDNTLILKHQCDRWKNIGRSNRNTLPPQKNIRTIKYRNIKYKALFNDRNIEIKTEKSISETDKKQTNAEKHIQNYHRKT